MHRRHIAVVGASLSGLRTVEALRRRGVDDRITLVGDEEHLPYDRPPLSKDVLLGKAEASSVALATRDSLAALAVEHLPGTRAVGLDPRSRTLHLVHRDRAFDLAYDDVVVATGATARRPAWLATALRLDGVHVLRSVDDATALRTGFETSTRVVVLGGGFIGAEVASAARALGLDVTVIDIAPVLMHRALGHVFGSRMTDRARDYGVDLRLQSSATEVLGTGTVEAVRLADGSLVPTDLLVVALGAAPNDSWLAGSGLEISDGLVCDAQLTAAPGVYAVGDVARWHHPLYGRTIRCEHWTAAGEHAEAVAGTLSGSPTTCDAVPWVWSDQFDVKLQIAGLLHERDEVRFLVDGPGKVVAIAGSDGVQHAAFGIGAPGALIRQRLGLANAPAWPPVNTQ